MTNGVIPNFFIVGAPKCGTTAMSVYLRGHPNVFMAQPKEPHHFAVDLDGISRIKGRKEYLALFLGRTESHCAVGEASVWYLFSQVAMTLIREFNPDARIVVMLRNPGDFLRSYHNHLIYSLIESETDFRVAWDLQKERAHGRSLPSRCRMPGALQYANVARFGEHVKRLLAVFPREQVYFILFEDFISAPRDVYTGLLAFLGLADDGRSVFPLINDARTHRSAVVATLLLNPPAPLRFVWTGLKRLFGPSIIRHPERLLSLNAKSKKPNPFDLALRREICVALEDDIKLLSQIIDRDLDSWLQLRISSEGS